MIKKTELATASSALQTGQFAGTKLAVIDGDRETVGTMFADRPSKLEVVFNTPVNWLDVTIQNENYGGAISAEGLGFKSDDIRVLIDPLLGCHTKRIEMKEPAKGKITFETKGGAGRMLLFDISGFLDKTAKIRQ